MARGSGAGRPPAADSAVTRDALIQACWDGLLRSSSDGGTVTVASICRAAGCTPPTLYHHFANLEELRRSACGRAFEDWSRDIDQRLGVNDSPADRLRLRAQAYFDWGTANPAAYRVLFLADTPVTGATSQPGRGFDALVADLATLMGRAPEDPFIATAALAHWAAVHGLTTFAITTPGVPADVWRHALDYLAATLPTDQAFPGRGRGSD